MATKTFKDICVEYAHQLGKGLPLTPAEMCNAVIMYLNSQITEMQGITTALQTAVTEAEASATEAINKANSASGKVDTLQTNVTEAESNATEALNTANSASEKVNTLQTAVTEAESNATEALNTANGVSETVNALPKVPKPTTSDNGKVIGVQSGAYALVEQSGGEAPDNMVTTDTKQTIYEYKNFVNGIGVTSGSKIKMNVLTIANDWVAHYNTTINFPNKGNTETTFATTDDIPNLDNYAENIDIVNGTTGNGIRVHDNTNTSPYTKYGYDKIETYGNSNTLQYTLNIPNKAGTLALAEEIDESINNILNSENTWSKKNTFGRGVDVNGQINIHNSDTSIERDGTLIVSGSMVYLQNYKLNEYYYAASLSNAQYNVDENIIGSVDYFIDGIYLTPLNSDKTNIDTDRGYLLKFPNKGGTIATLDDIPTQVTKYFTRVICTDSNTNTQYIFSCITNDDLSGNVYGDVVSLLTELGAINPTSALPCSGKTASGGAVIGVYTDGSAIKVFVGDNATEEIPTSAEINVISK